MLVFNVVGTKKTFKVPETWSEIILQDYAVFIDAITKLQVKLKEDEKLESGLYELMISYRPFLNEVFETFTGVKANIIEKLRSEDMFTIYNMMLNFLNAPEQEEKKSFTFKKVTYYLPSSKLDYFGNEIKMADATFGEVIEAMQVQDLDKSFVDNNYKVLPYQIAILCRPKGEEYDDQKVAERAELFKNLTMDIVWSVAFFLMRRKLKSLKDSLLFLELQKESSVE